MLLLTLLKDKILMSLAYELVVKGTDGVRTRDLRFTRPTPYHLATAPADKSGQTSIFCPFLNGKDVSKKSMAAVGFEPTPPKRLVP